jgi:transcriptional regulator with XRE-family HTH domain
MDEKVICQKIKARRQYLSMSLQDLANYTGLSKGYLSRVERANKLPPFSTLNKIAEALGVETISFFSDVTPPPADPRLAIVRAHERQLISHPGTQHGYAYQALAQDKPGKRMEPYIMEPAFDERGVFKHEGEEFFYTLEGSHEFIYDTKRYILHAGDSIYFDSGVPHSGRSLGRKKAKVLAVMFSNKDNKEL